MQINGALEKGIAGDLEGAIVDLDQVLSVDPEFTEAYHRRGYIHGLSGNWVQAIEDWTQVLAKFPEAAEPLHNRGVAFLQQGELELAQGDLDRVIVLAPDQPTPYLSRAQLLLQQQEYLAAIADANQALQILESTSVTPQVAPDPEATPMAETSEDSLGSSDEIVVDATETSEDSGIDPAIARSIELMAYQLRGLARYRNGDIPGAEIDLTRVIELQADLASAYHNRGYVRYQMDQAENGLADLTEAADLFLQQNQIDLYDHTQSQIEWLKR